MRVALLSRAVAKLHGYGGLERHVYELARYLAMAGVETTLYTMPPNVRNADEMAERIARWDLPVQVEMVTTPRLPLRGIADRVTNYPYWAARAGELIARQEYDVVHAQGLAAWGYARQKAQSRARAPLILNPQGMEEFKTGALKRLAYTPMHILLREAAGTAEAVIAADSQAYRDIPRYLRVPADKVYFIPNGIDVEACLRHVSDEGRRGVLARYQLTNRSPILLSVGRLEENKGFELLLGCLAQMRPMLPSKWVWVLVGEGPARPRLEETVRRARLHEHVRLLGRVDDPSLHNLYEVATLFVHPTFFEGSSLVTLEAMAHRKPIVATAVGGIPDKVLRGRNGFLAPPGNARELSDKIRDALSDPARLKQMGQVSFEIVAQYFDWPQTIGWTLGLYEQLVPRPRLVAPRSAA